MRIVGFDPGGAGQFGWCIGEANSQLPIAVCKAGLADSAADAFSAVQVVLGVGPPDGVGIDSPLFWVAKGDRRADQTVRAAIKRAGAKHAGCTVQQVNSLRGACITQGVLVAHLSRTHWPSVRITESHPKALLWLLGVALVNMPVAALAKSHLERFIRSGVLELTEHDRDAALGALGAWAMLTNAGGWRDLAACEKNAFMPVPMVEYWMPTEPAEQRDDGDERPLL